MTAEATLADLMREAKFLCLAPELPVAEASKVMLERRVGAVLVIEGDDPARLVGIMTERDINFRLVATGRDPATTTVADIMTRRPRSMSPETPVTEALKFMARSGYRHLPIKVDDKVVGIVSITDVFKESRRKLGHDMVMIERFIMGETEEPPETSH